MQRGKVAQTYPLAGTASVFSTTAAALSYRGADPLQLHGAQDKAGFSLFSTKSNRGEDILNQGCAEQWGTASLTEMRSVQLGLANNLRD